MRLVVNKKLKNFNKIGFVTVNLKISTVRIVKDTSGTYEGL